MYIVICETSNECWYNEFVSLDSALAYIRGYDDSNVYCRLFDVHKEISVEELSK